MKKYIKIYTFLILLLTFAFNSWSQPDSLGIVLNNSDSIIKIAYGEQSKASVSSSISTISGKELSKSSVSNVANTLYGKLPGLFVSQGAGQPGYESPNLRVRGADAAPLIIIDGFERDMTFISPDEIESVSLLKDAAAVALYGMKAINGALLITTKRGLNQKTEIDFKVQTGFQTPARTVEILNSENYMRMHNQASLNDGLVPMYSEQDIASAGLSPRYPDVDWKDEVLKKFSNVTKANLDVRGGSDFIQYYVNFGYLYNGGMYEPVNPDMNSNASLNRLNIRSNIDINVSKTTKFSMDFAGNMNKNTYPAYSANEIWNAIFTLPPNAFNVYNPDNSYGGTSLLLNNPVAMLETSGRNTSIDHFLNAGFRLNQRFDFIARGLSAALGFVLDNGANNSDGNWRYFQVRQIAPGTGDEYSYYTYREPTQYNTWSSASSTRYTNFNADVVYDMPEKNGNKLNVLLRYQADRQYWSNSDLSPYLMSTYAGRIQYSSNDKYILEAAASYFGSDQYAEGKQYGFFPSASVAWVFTNEDFFGNSGLVTFGKLKASYGVNGRNRYVNGRYPFMQYYVGGGSFPLGTGWDMYYGNKPGMLANPDIKWEVSNKLNLGLELSLMDNFTFAADYYIDKRSDMLYIDYTHPSTTGAGLPYENIGKLTYSGIDLKLGYVNSKNESVSWFADLVFSYFDNRIDEMGEALTAGNMSYLNRTGNSVSAIYGLVLDGYFESISDIQGGAVQTFGTPRVGDLKYLDLNSDNIIDSRDMKVIGDQVGNIELGFRAGINWNNIDVEAQFQGQFNRDLMLAWNQLYQPFLSGNSVSEIALEDGFPALSLTNYNNYQSSTYWVRNGNFLKLRYFELGYTFGNMLRNQLRTDNIRLFLRGVNVFTLSNWKYSDPEFYGIGYPPMKTFYLGATINF